MDMAEGTTGLGREDAVGGVPAGAAKPTRVKVRVGLGKQFMSSSEISQAANGRVLELDAGSGDDAELYLNGRLFAHGEVIAVDGKFAIRVREVTEAG